MSSQSPTSSLPLRRNGRPQACEPCRKRKMACDHGFPICQRCKKRKTTGDCVYLAAPMTRTPDKEQALPSPLSIISNQAPANLPPPASQESIGPRPAGKPEPKTSTLFTNPTSYLGSTSFSAVFWENQEDLQPAFRSGQSLQDLAASLQDLSATEAAALLHFPSRTSRRILRLVPSKEVCSILLNREHCTQDGWLKYGLRYCMDQLWETHGHYLADRANNEELLKLARILHRNAKITFQEPEDPQEWLRSFSGDNIRWEALGLLFCLWAYGAMTWADSDAPLLSLEGKEKNRNEFVLEMKAAASLCVTLCGETDRVNTLMVALLYKHNLLQSICSGDTSVLLWRQHGDLVSAATALGLHRELEPGKSNTNLPAEMRRRIFGLVFAIDKSLATFTGRPPVLSRRFCAANLPKDISDEVLLKGEPELSRAISRLDSNGWNTDGQIYPATTLRVKFIMSMIQDEILEFSLGNPLECQQSSILELKRRSEAIYETLPASVRFSKEDITADLPSRTLFLRVSLRSRHLLNHFLFEKLLKKCGETDGQALVDVARELMSLTLLVWTQSDRFVGYHFDYEWILMCYAIPPSGVLCVELLKQSKNAAHTPHINLPRSETIQNLSLLVGFLDWVRPGAPNYELCRRMSVIISQVLDQVLEGPSAAISATSGAVSGVGGAMHGGLGMSSGYGMGGEPGQVDYDFDLPADFVDFDDFGNINMVDTLDWIRAPWVDGTT